MANPSYILLPVENPRASAATYTKILGVEPVENSETFVLYVTGGLKVGLWAAREMEPKPGTPGGSEIAFSLESKDAVSRTFEEWKKLGLAVLQEPTTLDFGFTFVVKDADGHRLRGFVLADDPR